MSIGLLVQMQSSMAVTVEPLEGVVMLHCLAREQTEDAASVHLMPTLQVLDLSLRSSIYSKVHAV